MIEISPTELRLSADKRELHVTFADVPQFTLPAEMLRVMSPSAEVQGHTPSQRQLVTGKSMVKITRIEPVGHYAIRIVFDDSHDSGIYTWPYLRELGENRGRLWAAYVDEVAARQLISGS